jgi:hypothetical protein
MTFKTHSNKSYSKNANIFFGIKFRRNFEFFSVKSNGKILVIALVNPTIQNEFETQDLILSFLHQFHNTPLISTF